MAGLNGGDPLLIGARNQARDGFPRTAPGSPGRVGVALPLGDGEQGFGAGDMGGRLGPTASDP